LLAAEQRRLHPGRYGRLLVGVGYPASYHVAMSSLAFQWVVELTARTPDVGVERFVSGEGVGEGTLESATPLGDLDILAFSCSFELDAANVIRALVAAGIPPQRDHRNESHPLVVVGGAVASINPLPLSPAVDVFCLGAAEIVWPQLLSLAMGASSREALLADLAQLDGYLVPMHHLGPEGLPRGRLRRLEKRTEMMADPHLIPASHVVTPNTEYSRRGLVEMSRGCPEKCRYCWVSYNYGRLRTYSTNGILHRVDELTEITDRIGFVATAVGDHPDLAAILEYCRSRDLNVALSSLRIPAMVPEVLRPLAESGARSVTIAPETGSDRLRRSLGKPIENERILAAVDTAQRCGLENLKMYFILGLPGETDEDVRSIADLARQASSIVLNHGRSRGAVGTLHVGLNILVPKPYTPYHSEPILQPPEARRRLALAEQGLRRIPNLRLDRPSYRESLWQGFLSRAGIEAFPALQEIAAGRPLASVLRGVESHMERIRSAIEAGEAPWHFISSAPSQKEGPLSAEAAGEVAARSP
jgi:radical SAM superfamily enzyme YgiQ (UPF0313 family)